MAREDIGQLARRALWIFDLDGTLTRPQHDFIAIRQQLGIPEDADILGWIAARPSLQRQHLEFELDQIELEHARQSQVAPGAARLLEWLRSKGVCCAILTRNSLESAELSLQQIGLREYFSWIMAREQSAPKPAPDGILQLLQQAQCTAAQTVMVGDHLNDLMAGRAAGVITVHVDHRDAFAWSEWADYELPTLEALCRALDPHNFR